MTTPTTDVTIPLPNGVLTRILMLVSGVLGVVLPQLSTFGLSTTTSSVLSGIGGAILVVLGYLEHPTTKTSAAAPTTVVNTGASPPVG